MKLKQLIKMTARRAGIDLKRFDTAESEAARRQNLLRTFEIDTVLDIGACIGQYAINLRRLDYTGKIISFEPLAEAQAELKRVSARDPHWIVPPPCALGERDGEIEINVSKNLMSSSIRKMLDLHLSGAPDSYYVRTEKVPIFRLDSIIEPYLVDSRAILMKIDTQGYEAEVLEGALLTLRRVAMLEMELSLAPLYEGQLLFREMLDKATALNFELFDLIPVFRDKKGRLLQVDGIFVGRDKL